MASYNEAVAESVQVSAALGGTDRASVAESFTLTGAATTLIAVLLSASETLSFSGSASVQKAALVEVVESIALASGASSLGRFGVVVSDGFSLYTGFAETDDGIYEGWAVNTASGAASRYLQYGFNSFAELDGQYFGAKSDGLYILDGDSDDGQDIGAWLTTGLTMLGDDHLKRLAQCTIICRNESELELAVILSDGTEYTYPIDRLNESVTEARFKIGRGIRAAAFQFEIRNLEGGDFEIDLMRVDPLNKNRRV